MRAVALVAMLLVACVVGCERDAGVERSSATSPAPTEGPREPTGVDAVEASSQESTSLADATSVERAPEAGDEVSTVAVSLPMPFGDPFGVRGTPFQDAPASLLDAPRRGRELEREATVESVSAAEETALERPSLEAMSREMSEIASLAVQTRRSLLRLTPRNPFESETASLASVTEDIQAITSEMIRMRRALLEVKLVESRASVEDEVEASGGGAPDQDE